MSACSLAPSLAAVRTRTASAKATASVRPARAAPCLAGSTLALHNCRPYTATSSMTRMSATPEGQNASRKSTEEDEKTSEMMAQIFGSNLQVTVWVCTLSYAGYTGYQQMQVDPSSVGMLLAPPLGALALMTSFGLFYSAKLASQKDAAAALAAKRAAEEAEEAK